MANPPFDINETIPEDDDIVSQHPATARVFRDVVESWILAGHDTNGEHKPVVLPEVASDPTNEADKGIVYTKDVGGATELFYIDSDGNVVQLTSGGVSGFESGTKMVFAQAAAPAGWTQDNTWNDRVLRVVDNTGTGAATGGSWTISGLTVDGHSITVAELPSYNLQLTLSGRQGNDTDGANRGPHWGADALGTPSSTANISSGGSNNAHTHGLTADGNWRPAHLDVIVATKD